MGDAYHTEDGAILGLGMGHRSGVEWISDLGRTLPMAPRDVTCKFWTMWTAGLGPVIEPLQRESTCFCACGMSSIAGETSPVSQPTLKSVSSA